MLLPPVTTGISRSTGAALFQISDSVSVIKTKHTETDLCWFCISFATLPLLHTLPYLYFLPPLLFFLLFTKHITHWVEVWHRGQSTVCLSDISVSYSTCFCFSLKTAALASSSSCILLRAASMASWFLTTTSASLEEIRKGYLTSLLLFIKSQWGSLICV